jgi:hypothetical protein
MPADGGPAERVTSDPGEERFPQWSPDGKSLTYYLRDAGDRNGAYVVSRDSLGHWGTPRRVHPYAQGAEFLPDGTGLFIADEQGLRTLPFDGSSTHVFYPPANGSPLPLGEIPRNARLAGSAIVLKSYDARGNTAFWIMPLTGGTPRLVGRLNDPTRLSTRVEFATDGKRVFFTLDERQSDVYMAALQGLSTKRTN